MDDERPAREGPVSLRRRALPAQPRDPAPSRRREPALADEWAVRFHTVGAPRMRLFCFPHAGAGAAFYAQMFRALPPGIEVRAVQRPGRENLVGSPLLSRIEDLVGATTRHLQGLLDLPYAFFGHSMGALLAFEILRELEARGAPMPRATILSAFRAPHIAPPPPHIARYPRAEFFEAVRTHYRDVPADLLQYERTASYFEGILRADFAACEDYRFPAPFRVGGRVTILGGRTDPLVQRADLEAWSDHCQSAPEVTLFDGGHMYLTEDPDGFLRALTRSLAALESPAGSPDRG